MKALNSVLWCVVFCLAFPIGIASGQEAPRPKVIAAASDNSNGPDMVALRDRLTLTVTNLSTLLAQAKSPKKAVVLYINGVALKGIEPEAADTNKNQLRFHLVRTEEARKAWAALLGNPWLKKNVSVSVGLEGEVPIETDVEKFPLVVIRLVGFWFFVAAVGGLTIWLWKKQTRTEMLRDPGPKPPDGQHRPYSLAKVQMAIWFWLTVTSFLFIYVITYTFDTIPTSVFVLMGISAATGLGAMVQDSGKDPDEGLDKLEKERRELAAIATATRTPEQDKRLKDVQSLIDWHHQPPASEGFLKDILTDAQGTSFHRLQMFIWTLVLVYLGGRFTRT